MKKSAPLQAPISLTFRLNVLGVHLYADAPTPQWDRLWGARFQIMSDEELPLHDHPAQIHHGSHQTYLDWKANPAAFNDGCRIMYGRPETTRVEFSNMGASAAQMSIGDLVGMRESPEVRISELNGKLRLLWRENPLLAALLEANNDELLKTHFRVKNSRAK